MLDPLVVTDVILATLVLHNTLYNSPYKSVYCPTDFADSESLDGDVIYGSWQNNTLGETI